MQPLGTGGGSSGPDAVQDLFVGQKPILAMAHLGPLPGAPGYDARGGIDALIAAVAAEVARVRELR